MTIAPTTIAVPLEGRTGCWDPDRGGLLVVGLVGSGKTTLLRRIAAGITSESVDVICYPGEAEHFDARTSSGEEQITKTLVERFDQVREHYEALQRGERPGALAERRYIILARPLHTLTDVQQQLVRSLARFGRAGGTLLMFEEVDPAIDTGEMRDYLACRVTVGEVPAWWRPWLAGAHHSTEMHRVSGRASSAGH